MDKEEYLKAIDDSIDHWNRMIEWVDKQNPNKCVDSDAMKREIRESWSGCHCALCNICNDDCGICPLHLIGKDCNNDGSPWMVVSDTDDEETWGKWLEAAKGLMIPALKEARKYVEDLDGVTGIS